MCPTTIASSRKASSSSDKTSSCALNAPSTFQMYRKSDDSKEASGVDESGTTTGSTIVPIFFSAERLIALPTACTMSVLLRLGSAKTTPSSVGTSTPSVSSVRSKPRWDALESHHEEGEGGLVPVGIPPSTWVAQISAAPSALPWPNALAVT